MKALVTGAAGFIGMSLFTFIWASTLSRAFQFMLVGFLFWKFGAPIKAFIEKYLAMLSAAFLVLIVVLKWVFLQTSPAFVGRSLFDFYRPAPSGGYKHGLPAEAVAGPFGGCQGVRFNNSPRPEVSASFPPRLRRTRREEARTLPWV